MQIEFNEHHLENFSEMDSETPKSISLPKTKKIHSVDSVGSSTKDSVQMPPKKYKKD